MSATPISPSQSVKILIVEDSPTQAQRLQHILEQQGYHVTHAANGRLALEAARSLRYTLIISDVVMPEMDGYELCRRVKSEADLSDTPVILVTTLTNPQDVIRGLECRADNFILKPYDESHLLGRVQFVLLNRQVRQAERAGMGVEVFFNGQKHFITADRLQILNLLLSTYDAAILRNKELSDSEALNRAVLNSIMANIAVVDRHGAIIAVNDGWARFAQEHGSDTELQGVGVGANYHDACERAARDLGQEAQRIMNGLRGVLEHSQETFKYEYPCHSPTEQHWFTMQVSPLGRAEAGAVIAHINITERKRAENVLADFKAALDQHAIVATTDARGKITYVNDKFCEISKYAREELMGQDHRIINSGYHPKEFIQNLWSTIQEGRVWKGEIRNRAKDGTFYWVDTTIIPFLGADGQPMQFIAIRADITKHKQAQEQIVGLNTELHQRAAQLEAANKELESFSYSVSHDLRAPLRHVQGYVQMLDRATEGQLSDKARRYLKTITDASVEMGQLIDDLLAFSRMGRVEMQETRVSLDVLVRDTVRGLEMATNGRNIAWKIRPLPQVLGDPATLKQVLANLIGNAVKYSRQRDPAEIEIGCDREEDGRAIFFVRDNGAGFDMKYVQKLFGVFQRLHRAEDFEGTGIGLATVRRIIVRHGGRTWAEGALNEGATFFFTLQPARTI